MGKFEEMYSSKLRTADEISKLLHDGYVCASPICMGEPFGIVQAIAKRSAEGSLHDVEINGLLSMPGPDYLKPELYGKIKHTSWFFGPGSRKGGQEGQFDYIPGNYSDFSMIWTKRRLDVCLLTVSPMDKHGYFSMGPYACIGPSILRQAKHVFVEVNKHMPRTYGENIVHISQVEALCENDRPLPELAVSLPSEEEKKMGSFIAEMVPYGATIQLGIGGVAGAIGKALINKKDLGIHTEMFSDSMVDLIEAGVVTNERKNIFRGRSVSAFCFGSKRVYDFIDENLGVEMLPVEYVNNPYVISQLDNFISVNAGMEVDFLGQVCAESIGPVPFSGSGGQFDYVKGVKMSRGGRSFIAMNSTAKNGALSKIKPMLTPGAAVTTHKNEVDCIVTEYGVAELMGKTVRERTKALINIAHPKFREELEFEAKKMNILI